MNEKTIEPTTGYQDSLKDSKLRRCHQEVRITFAENGVIVRMDGFSNPFGTQRVFEQEAEALIYVAGLLGVSKAAMLAHALLPSVEKNGSNQG